MSFIWYKKNNIPKIYKSYGLITFYSSPSDGIKVLLYQPRNTYGYETFINGLWEEERYAINLLSTTTQEERERLLTCSFDDLWDDLYVCGKAGFMQEKFVRSKFRFSEIKPKLADIFKNNPIIVEDTGWAFPKGRINDGEIPREAALREFYEETGLNYKTHVIDVYHTGPFKEEWIGTNAKIYQAYYFIAFSKHEYIAQIQTSEEGLKRKYISDESIDFKWFSLEEAYKKLDPRRQYLLKSVVDYLKL